MENIEQKIDKVVGGSMLHPAGKCPFCGCSMYNRVGAYVEPPPHSEYDVVYLSDGRRCCYECSKKIKAEESQVPGVPEATSAVPAV